VPGKAGALTATRNLCRGAVPRLTADFAGHDGKTAKTSIPMRGAGCGPAVSIRPRGLPQRPRLSVRVMRAPDAAPLRRVALTLPARLRGVPAPHGALVARHGLRRRARLTFVVRTPAADGRRTMARIRVRGR
jgi:hypothetical protein